MGVFKSVAVTNISTSVAHERGVSAPAPVSHCRSNFLPYSHCSGGGYILYGGVFII